MIPVKFRHIRAAGRSLAHAKAALEGVETEVTPPMRLGSAAHALVLGGKPVVFYPGPVRRGKEWDAFEAAHGADLIVTRDEYERANRIADAVRANPLAMDVLGGVHETTIEWTQGGRACSGTPDAAEYGSHTTDLKTCRDADPERFAWAARRAHYHVQLAWYQGGVRRARLGNPQNAYIVAVESVEPYPVTVFRLTPRLLDEGDRIATLWLERLLNAERTGEWPGYAQALVDLDVMEDDLALTFAEEAA